jgi:hypothetical protein
MVEGNSSVPAGQSVAGCPVVCGGPALIAESNCLQSENYYSWQSAAVLVGLFIFVG